MRVLIGVDGSPVAQLAVECAARFFDPARDEVCLYYAPPEIRLSGEDLPEVLAKARDALAATVFDDAKKRLPEAMRARATTVVGRQQAARGILLAAEEKKVDMIVMGAHAEPKPRWQLGSVSRAVVHQSKVPVLVVRYMEAPPSGVPSVVVAYDGSEASRQSIGFMQRLTWPEGTRATLATVIEPLFVGEAPKWVPHYYHDPEIKAIADQFAHQHEAEREQKRSELAALAAGLPAQLRNAEIVVAEGQASEQLLALVEERKCDLVVAGTRGMGIWERLFLGSTTERLLTHALCSILVVPYHETP